MTKPADCPHENFRANVAVHRLLDSGTFTADITVHCAECGEPFRFVGIPSGVSFNRPMVSIDGLELRAPIEPQGTPILQTKTTFEVPNVPTRH